MLDIVGLLKIFFCVVFLYISKQIYKLVVRYKRWKTASASIPEIKCFPIVGSIFRNSNLNTIIPTAYEDFLKYGSPMKLSILKMVFLILVAEPSQIQTVCCSPESEDKPHYYRYSDDVLCQGLITATTSRWKTTRKYLNPLFHQKTLEDFVNTFIDMSHDFIRDLGKYANQSSFNVLPLIMEHQTHVIGQTLLGSTLNLEETGFNFYKYFSRFSELMIERSLLKPWLTIELIYNISPIKQTIYDAGAKIHTFLSKIVKDKQSKLEEINSDEINKSFLDKLLRMNSLYNIYTDKQLNGEITTMFVASIDTTAIGLSYALVMLGIHKNIQNKVFDEIITVMDSDATLTYQHLQQMSYTDKVIKEVLRLYPPVPFILRDVKDDLKIGVHTLPAGTTCIVSPFIIHRNPEIWPDPLTFNPDRFESEKSKTRHPYAYIPFGAGSRNCIGRGYAMLSLKVSIVNLLRIYEVSCDLKENDIKLRLKVTMTIIGGFNISLRRRI